VPTYPSTNAQRSMKGAVKKNISPPTGYRDAKPIVAAPFIERCALVLG